MAKVRFIGPEPHSVPELGDRLVDVDEVVTVPDDRFEAYLLQPHLWESVEEPKEPAEPTARTAKKTASRRPAAKAAAAPKPSTTEPPTTSTTATSATETAASEGADH